MSTPTMTEHAIAAGTTFPWHELYVANAPEAMAFYTEALGFEAQAMEMGEMGTYHMLARNGKAICGVMPTADNPGMENVPPHWAVYLSVDDVDARLEKCISMGAKVVVPPMDIPSVGRMTLIQDPQGAHLWLYKDAS